MIFLFKKIRLIAETPKSKSNDFVKFKFQSKPVHIHMYIHIYIGIQFAWILWIPNQRRFYLQFIFELIDFQIIPKIRSVSNAFLTTNNFFSTHLSCHNDQCYICDIGIVESRWVRDVNTALGLPVSNLLNFFLLQF